MADPLGGDQFDVEQLAEAEVEKLMKQVSLISPFLLQNNIFLINKFYLFINAKLFSYYFCFIFCSVPYY